jgi:hypothetical protein
MADNTYYTQQEVDIMIKDSIVKNAKKAANEIQAIELKNKDISYV